MFHPFSDKDSALAVISSVSFGDHKIHIYTAQKRQSDLVKLGSLFHWGDIILIRMTSVIFHVVDDIIDDCIVIAAGVKDNWFALWHKSVIAFYAKEYENAAYQRGDIVCLLKPQSSVELQRLRNHYVWPYRGT